MKRLLSYSVVMFVITIILLLIIPLPAGLVDDQKQYDRDHKHNH